MRRGPVRDGEEDAFQFAEVNAARDRDVIFLNYPLETFTPTKSGAIATIIWECCQEALKSGAAPWVITRSCEIPPFVRKRTLMIKYPSIPAHGARLVMAKLERKLTGWRHLRQAKFARSVARAVRESNLSEGVFVIFNDPEWVIDLRVRFPKAILVHWFQNEVEIRDRYRTRFREAVDVILSCSDFIARWVESHYELPTGHVHTVYNGVDEQRFAPPGESAPGPIVLNFVGRTGIEKGPDLLLKAAIALAEEGHHFGLQIIGSNHWDRYEEDAYQRELTGLVRRLEALGISVRCTGHVGREALPSELRRAHIHIVPARWDEPFGMTTLEGMACGLATVASATGGTPEVVGDGALLFQRESVEDLRGCLARLLTDTALRRKLSLRARQQAEQFTWQRTWTSLLTAIADRGYRQSLRENP